MSRQRSSGSRRRAPSADVSDGAAARRLALDALVRIDEEGAYANLVTGALLGRSSLAERDRRFVTELVYGTTRMRRACDHLVDRHRRGDVTPRVRAALRMGAYQLAFAGTPAHAAVDATVSASPKPARGLVNAVLRRVADDLADGGADRGADGGADGGVDGIAWPDLATELSYPDWIVDALTDRLGSEAARGMLAAMNQPAPVHVRADGYVQDVASQRVVDLVGVRPGERVLDACAAPGGKATGLAGAGVRVVAADRSPARCGLIVQNLARVQPEGDVVVVAADATAPPFAPASFDRVLVDAPCSGLGVLRRRPDARWRIEPDAVDRLHRLQVAALLASAPLLAPGGRLVYSVCTLTIAENQGVVEAVTSADELAGWTFEGDVTMVADDPADGGTDGGADGMYVATWTRGS